MAARPIGGLCSKVLRFAAIAGMAAASLEDVLLRHALGEDISAIVARAARRGRDDDPDPAPRHV